MIKLRWGRGAVSVDPALGRRLRDTLHGVAETITEAPSMKATDSGATPAARPRRRARRRVAAILLALTLPVTAAGYLLGGEYVHELPPKNPLVSGDAHGERYWLIPGRVKDDCGHRVSDVELVVEKENKIGREWRTIGIGYGDPVDIQLSSPTPVPGEGGVYAGTVLPCGVDESGWLADPSKFADASSLVDSDRIFFVAAHSSVTTIQVSASNGTVLTVPTKPLPDRPDGPRFAAFDVPASAAAVVVTLIDVHGKPIPGGSRDLRHDGGR